jgi:hypothetical protein
MQDMLNATRSSGQLERLVSQHTDYKTENSLEKSVSVYEPRVRP